MELFHDAGIFRDENSLNDLVKSIEKMQTNFNKLTLNDKSWLVSHLKFKNTLEVAYAMVLSAQKRKESRGAHFRNDFKQTDTEALHSYIDSSLVVRFES